MRKFLLSLILAVAILIPSAQAAGSFSDWKCSQCGKTRHMAGQHQPPANGCKVSSDGKHIWFKI